MMKMLCFGMCAGAGWGLLIGLLIAAFARTIKDDPQGR